MSSRPPAIHILGSSQQQVAISRQLWADLMNALPFDSDQFLQLLLAAPISWERDVKIPEAVLAEYEQAADELEREEAANQEPAESLAS